MKTFKEFISESFGRDTWKAIKTHYKVERKRKNPLMHPALLVPTIATVGTTMAHSIATKDYVSALSQAATWGMASSDHISDIKRFRNRIKEVRKGQEKQKEFKKAHAEYLKTMEQYNFKDMPD